MKGLRNRLSRLRIRLLVLILVSALTFGQAHNAPELALAHAPLDGKQHLAQPLGVGADRATV